MNEELQQKLYDKYPKIFRQKDLPESQTCMCWGIDCGDGWYNIIDNLCNVIQSHVENKIQFAKYNAKEETINPDDFQVEAAQVKQKWGGLCFYVDKGDEYAQGCIDMAESMSYITCEECGSTDQVKSTTGWITRLCGSCYAEWEKERYAAK